MQGVCVCVCVCDTRELVDLPIILTSGRPAKPIISLVVVGTRLIEADLLIAHGNDPRGS